MSLLIGEIFRRNAQVVPDRVAASLGDETLTYRELDHAGNRLANALRELGVGRGDRVVSWADTCLDVLPLFVALAKLGAVFAPLNARLAVEEASDIVRFARPRLLVADPGHGEAATRVAKAAGVPLSAHLGGGDEPGADLDALAATQSDAGPDTPDLVETDPHVIFFTSGSTGRPKGVVLSHRANYLRSFQGVFRDEPERTVCMFPLFHMAAFTLGLAAWQTRGEMAFVRGQRRGGPRHRGRAPAREPPLLHSGGLGAHPRGRPRALRHVESARDRHRHFSDTDRADPRA